jgi:hypothetical protein
LPQTESCIPALLKEGGKANLESQCIPTEMPLLDEAQYKAFLVERRKRISACLSAFLEVGP